MLAVTHDEDEDLASGTAEPTAIRARMPADANAEEALERAAVAWRAAREALDRVDPRALPDELRENYYRLVIRIGLWADARALGDEPEDAARPQDDARASWQP